MACSMSKRSRAAIITVPRISRARASLPSVALAIIRAVAMVVMLTFSISRALDIFSVSTEEW